MKDTMIHLDSVLNTASRGLELAHQVLASIEQTGSAHLDFSPVRRVTPSFSNAFVMTLLGRHSVDVLQQKLRMDNRNPLVTQAITDSVRRYQSGIRLTTQRETTDCDHAYA